MRTNFHKLFILKKNEAIFFLIACSFCCHLISFAQFYQSRFLQTGLFVTTCILITVPLFLSKGFSFVTGLIASLLLAMGYTFHAIFFPFHENPALIICFVLSVGLLYIEINNRHHIPTTITTNTVFYISIFLLVYLSLEIYWRFNLFSNIAYEATNYKGELFRLSGNVFNPNRWAASISILIAAIFSKAIKTPSTKTLIPLFIFFAYGLFSLSKTFFISILLFIAFVSFINFSNLRRIFVVSIICVIAAYTGFTFSPEKMQTKIIASGEIIASPYESNTFKERIKTYEEAFEALEDNLVLGVGIEGLERSPHNNFLAHYAYFGIIGIIIFLLLFIVPFIIVIKSAENKHQKVFFTFLFILVTMNTSLSSMATDVVAQINYILSFILAHRIIKSTFYYNNPVPVIPEHFVE